MYEGYWEIYTLHDPRKPSIIRYVGWTKSSNSRLHSHIIRAKNGGDQTYCGKWKRSILKEGFEPVLTIIEVGEGPGWVEAERRWISYYRSLPNSKLTNLADGGGGPAGHHWKLSEETRKRMIYSNRGKFTEEARRRSIAAIKGIPQKPEHIAKGAAARRGKQRSKEAVANSALGHIGIKHTEEAKEKIRAYHKRSGLQRAPKKRTLESRMRTSNSLKAYYAEFGSRKMTPKTKSKISNSNKDYHARIRRS